LSRYANGFKTSTGFLIFYSISENLVLWARSELTGYAEEKCRGMMEYWKVGIMGSEG
jgi:hypothetical protein